MRNIKSENTLLTKKFDELSKRIEDVKKLEN